MVEKVVNVKVVDNVQATTQNVANLKTQLRQAQNEVNELSAKFGATSKEAVEAAKRAAELKDAIGDAKALTDAFNPDAKFKALTSTLGGVAGGFSAVQGAIGLMGAESENVEKAILKVQSAMAISQGVQAIGESVDSFKQLGAVIRSTTLYQKALAGATAVQTFVMNGATLAAKLLRGALISTGVGALIVGVGLLIANFDKVKKVVMNLVPGLAIMGDVVMGIVNAVTDFVGVTSEAEREAERLVNKSKESLVKNKRFMDEHGDQIDEYTKRKIEANDKYNQAVADGETNLVELRKRADREIEQADKDRQAEKDKKAKEAQDKIDEAEKTRLSKIKENQDAQDKIRNAAYEHEKIFVEEQLKDSKLSIDEKRNIVIADMALSKKDREKFLYDLHLEEQKSQEDHVNKLKDINKRYDEEKQNRLADTNVKKEDLDYQNRILEIESITQTETEKQNLIEKLDEEHKSRLQEARKADVETEKAATDAKIALALAEKKAKMDALDAVGNSLNGMAELLGKQTAVGKTMAVASATISTIVGAQSAYENALKIPFVGTVLAPINAGIAIAAGMKNVQSILAVKTPGGGGGGGGVATSKPPQFNIVGQSGTNQLAQTIAGQQNKPIEAFVVSSAVTTSQSLDRNRVKTATFGG